ncbi:poly polymerase [Trichonephila clavipes]|nr:poly polymerase [Trichonephila clavipes]
MIPAYNKKRCAAFPFETGIHFRRKTDFFPEEDATVSYSGFEPEPTRLQAEGHSHHTGRVTVARLPRVGLGLLNKPFPDQPSSSASVPQFLILKTSRSFSRQ